MRLMLFDSAVLISIHTLESEFTFGAPPPRGRAKRGRGASEATTYQARAIMTSSRQCAGNEPCHEMFLLLLTLC